jgi:hypothetical protein
VELKSQLPSGSSKRVFIVLANLLRLPPVVTGVDVVYCYLSTMPAEVAIYVHLLEMCWRSLCITVFVFHSRASRAGASPLELLLGACDPSYRPLSRGGAPSESRLLSNLRKLSLTIKKWKVHGADSTGLALEEDGEKVEVQWCYALTIDTKFRELCDLGNLYRNKAVRDMVDNQRNELVYVNAAAAKLDASVLIDVNGEPRAIRTQSQQSHWHYDEDTASIGSFFITSFT